MSHQSDLIATDINAYLAQHERKELLRLLTCGSVDDGKSTLIGRLLYDSKMIYEDQLAAIRKDSLRHGTTGDDFDPALLTDGLKAEREQGITIDVAYRYFSTAKRKFIIADTPGHEQYTRNMATGASTCDLAIILIDARHGIVTQTRRHSFIASLLGIRHIVVAINKMDLVDYSEDVYDRIRGEYTDLSARLEIGDVRFIPISALKGDNVVEPSTNMSWYQGSTMMHLLENVHIASDRNLIDLRFPVQYVNRPDLNFRGFCGTVASGVVRKGDELVALPSGRRSKVKSIVTFDGELDSAFAPQAVTLTLEDEIDVSRGDVLVHPNNVPRVADTFEAMVVWMADAPLSPGRQYSIKQMTKDAIGTIKSIRYRMNVNTLNREPAERLALNEIGRCAIRLNQPIAFDAYKRNRATGAFIVIDRVSNVTVGAGMILDTQTDAARRDHWETEPQSETLSERPSDVTPDERAARFGQRPVTLLLTGLGGSGKTSIARALERRLFEMGRACAVLDGQSMRLGLSRDLGFTQQDRSENLRRAAELFKVLNENGLICIAAFVAPTEAARQRARNVVGADRMLIVHCAAPLEYCQSRDTSGIYERAASGELANIPGVSFPYEAPASPDLVLATDQWSVEACVEELVAMLAERGVIDGGG
ncbi:MAG: sulfate adenylyltransferase subunit CysN [Phycisphaerales bacterium]|nr:sulfate adenylyltransferase subunit CysN [Phycisphaerales bacterium]MCB9862731.1 sulfate adenylyltransferase subunit CysN [Phycisphaerales bacterium]